MKSSLKLLAAACLAILAAACIKTEKNVEELSGEEIVLDICPSGEILTVSDDPLSKAGLPDGTLYVVSVYQGTDKYAHGVFDDPSQMSVRLNSGKSFSIQVKAVKAGVAEIASASSVYEGNGLLDNQFHYYASDKTDEAFYGNTADIAALESQWLLDTYYGAATLTPTPLTSNVNIMLYRMMHKMTVRVEGFEAGDGSVAFVMDPYLPGTAAFSLNPEAAEYGKFAVINTNFEEVVSAISGNNDYARNISVSAEYSSIVNGAPYVKKLIDAVSIAFRRKRETTLALNFSHNYLGNVTASLTLTVEGEDMDVSVISIPCEVDSGASGSSAPLGAVDLGLSVYWASCNLCENGFVSTPEQYGDYYAWGETEAKSDYSWSTYKFSTNATGPFSKYNVQSTYGPVDNLTTLVKGPAGDDAASRKLGGSWRMPTDAEWTELKEQCTWTWTDNYNGTGIAGQIVTSKKSGYTDKSIFLPATGYKNGSSLTNAASSGYYWSASLDVERSTRAAFAYFNSGSANTNVSNRYYGRAVRPVYGEFIHVTGISLSPSSAQLAAGESYQLTAIISPADASNAMVSWSSTNTSVATVDGDGLVTAHASGTATITAETVDGGFTASCEVTVSSEAVVRSVSVESVSPFSASFACNLSKTEGVTEYGICYSEGNSLCNNILRADNIDSNGDFSVVLTGLQPNTTYYYKAYVVIGGIASFSAVSSFVTQSLDGFVGTTGASEISAFSAKLSGTLSIASAPGITYGVCYSKTNQAPTLSDGYKNADSIENGSFSVKVYGLAPSSDYYYRTFAKSGTSIAYGETKVFHTDASSDVVITGDYSNVTYSSARISGYLNLDKTNYSSLSYGFIFNGKAIITASNLDDDNRFSIDKTKLCDNTLYTYQAVVQIDGNMYYGEELSFETPEIVVETSGAVDLGLSVKWSATNLGASSPELFGSYFAWGETTTKSSYSWSNYKWCMGTEKTLTKYNTDSEYGIVDNIMTLELEDDAAHVNLGGNWRMPTSSEFSELINNCNWVWSKYKGQPGCKIISKISGYTDKAIFLPHYDIWSEYYSSTTGYAYSYVDVLEFCCDEEENENEAYARVSVLRRADGCPIRPVSD